MSNTNTDNNGNTAKYGSIPESEQETTSFLSNNNHGGWNSSSSRRRTIGSILLVIAVVSIGYIYVRPDLPFGTNSKSSGENDDKYAFIDEDDDYHDDLMASDIPEMYYTEQYIDHNHPERGYYAQRYYEVKKYFGGPGHPLFIIMAGEDDLDEILYPFVWKTMGQQYKAYSINIEHRYYGSLGQSWPLPNPSHDDLLETLSPRAALLDAVRLIKAKQEELGCGPRGTPEYCPVITVGGSYPGFLAGLLRILYPDVVDIGYASSAPFLIYSHAASTTAYFDHITYSAETTSPGCARAVKDTLVAVQQDIVATKPENLVRDIAPKYGLCTDAIPDYMVQSSAMFSEELMESIASHFAEHNMGYYPPRTTKDLFVACRIFQNETMTTAEKITQFLQVGVDPEEFPTTQQEDCFDVTTDLPPYPNATISASDWSGVGGGPSGVFWDFQCCQLMPECGFSKQSMFPERQWTIKWQTEHCLPRFNITPDPKKLVQDYQFGDLTNVTRLLFVNGLVDGWSAASYTQIEPNWNPDHIKIVNILNGAHHSDLRQKVPNPTDTPDLTAAYWEISNIIGQWLQEVVV